MPYDQKKIVEAIRAFERGEIVVVMDDDGRENEGDLIVAAVHCTPEKMAFIVRNTSGIVCTPMPREEAKRLNLQPADFARFDIHIHVPAGATPKDGPSAGSTIAVALASLLTQRLVRSDLAMTGEISLRGRILRVGGIKEKVLAAARSGLRQVALPAQNKNDWQEVPDEVRAKMKVHFVNHISELLEIALRPK